MKPYAELTREELEGLKAQLKAEYKEYQGKGLSLNMDRGKPCTEQLDLSMGMMDVLGSGDDLTCEDGTDCRNYGVLDGIREAKELIGDMMENPIDSIIIYGNSSLNVMYDTISRSMTHGVMGSTPWCRLDKVKFLCPVPGYDRHFSITQYFGIDMINVPMTPTGPDMDLVEELVASDEAIKGIWCVPKYSNPTGVTYSNRVVRRFAKLRPAAQDFRIFWDNAYAVHYVYEDTPVLNLLEECKKAGNPDMVYMFGSTSKITFPGAGVAFFAASKENVDFFAQQLNAQSISWDKMNMLRHVRFFKDVAGIKAQMDKHAAILRPKFDAVLTTLESELGQAGVGSWVKPKGGYFVTYISMPGCAKRIVALCKEAGVVLTGAGATHPYHKDPDDSYIRLAPSFPAPAELAQAMEVFCVAAKLAAVEKLLG